MEGASETSTKVNPDRNNSRKFEEPDHADRGDAKEGEQKPRLLRRTVDRLLHGKEKHSTIDQELEIIDEKIKKKHPSKVNTATRIGAALIAGTIAFHAMDNSYPAEAASPLQTTATEQAALTGVESASPEYKKAMSELNKGAIELVDDLWLPTQLGLVGEIKKAPLQTLRDYVNTGDKNLIKDYGDNFEKLLDKYRTGLAKIKKENPGIYPAIEEGLAKFVQKIQVTPTTEVPNLFKQNA